MLTKEQLQLIDKHFSKNDLSNIEQREFDNLLSHSPGFKEEFEFRKSLKSNLFRRNIRQSVQVQIKKAKVSKIMKIIGLTSAGTAVVVGALAFVVVNFMVADRVSNFPTEPIKELKSDNVTKLDVVKGEVFHYDADEPLVAESDNGTVIVIPENAFIDAKGNEVGQANVKLQEYLKPEDILLAGLSTESSGLPLESGGMFNLTATDKDGKILKLQEGKEVLFEVPTNERKVGMQVFDGETDADGNINWVNPKKLENYLSTVDIKTLDFYPPGYLKKLDELGYGDKSKEYKDSLFYSFYCSGEKEQIRKYEGEDFSGVDSSDVLDEFVIEISPIIRMTPKGCGITPSQIKTIWNSNYQNTYIATREFEKRLKVMYDNCNSGLLGVYLNNMNQPMSVVDNKAYKLTGDNRFKEFYERNTGTVNVADELLEALNEYYQKKSKSFNEIAQKLYEDYQNNQRKLDEEAGEKAKEDVDVNSKRKYENYWAEYGNNVEKANSDLGTKYKYKKGVGITSFSNGKKYPKYQFRVSSLGPKNIDRFMKDVLATRETSTFEEKNGKTTTLAFKEVEISLPSDSFDLVRVYFTNPRLFSFVKAKGTSGKYSYRLNESMDYNLVIVCQKGEQVYFYGRQSIKESMSFSLEELKPVESLSDALKPYSNRKSNKDISKDIDYQNFIKKDSIRIKKATSVKELRRTMKPIVFPCDIKTDVKRSLPVPKKRIRVEEDF